MARPVVIVTGVSRRRGIAAAVVRKLAASGWDIVLTGWPAYDETVSWGEDTGVAEELLSEATAAGVRAVYAPADLSKVDAIADVFDRAQEALGPVTALVVVHNYESESSGGLLEVTPAEFDRSMAANPRATLFLMAEFARRFSGPKGRGRIVTFTSGLPLKGTIAYAASKGAIEWITVSGAAELAGAGITANAVNPGPIDTGWMNEDLLAWHAEQSPLGRTGKPGDTAELVAFLCSENSGWITGQILTSDGGWSTLRAATRTSCHGQTVRCRGAAKRRRLDLGWLSVHRFRAGSGDSGRPAVLEVQHGLGGRFLAKFAWSRPAAVRLAHEIGTLTALTRAPRVPFLPEVVASSTAPVFLVTSLTPGTSLFEVADSIDRDRAGRQLACFLAALHQPSARQRAEAVIGRLSGPELPPATTGVLRDRFATWARPDQRRQIMRWCDWADAALASPGPAVLVHGDLHGDNQVWDHGELRLMVDFETVGAAEPEYDLRTFPGPRLGPGVELLTAVMGHYQQITGRRLSPDRVMAWHLRAALGDALWRSEAGIPLPDHRTPAAWADDLSARFTALGIVPDSCASAGTSG